MKINEWKNLNIYKYFYNGISKSNEIQYLDIPTEYVNNLYTYAYISEIPYIDNMISVQLEKNILTKNSFSYNIKIDYGENNNKEKINDHIYVNWKENSKRVVKSFSAYSFYLNIGHELWSTRDVTWGKVKYRYTYKNNTSDWITMYDESYQTSHGTTVTKHKQEYISSNLYPMTEEVYYEIEITLGCGSRSTGVMDISIDTYNYLRKTTNGGKLHWFAFIS